MSVTLYQYNIHFAFTCFPLTSWVELHLRSIELLYEPDLKIILMCELVQQAHASCHVFMPLSAELRGYTSGTQRCRTSVQQLISSETEVKSAKEYVFVNV